MKSKEEIKKWLLENCVDDEGLNLSGLDFSDFDGNVYFDGVKAKHSIVNSGQEAKYIRNNHQKAKIDIYNHRQKASDIYNNHQEANNTIHSEDQRAVAIINDRQNAKRIYNDDQSADEWIANSYQKAKTIYNGEQEEKDENKKNKHKAKTCPECDSKNLEYEAATFEYNIAMYPWTCKDCQSYGNEWYQMTFIEHTDIDKEV